MFLLYYICRKTGITTSNFQIIHLYVTICRIWGTWVKPTPIIGNFCVVRGTRYFIFWTCGHNLQKTTQPGYLSIRDFLNEKLSSHRVVCNNYFTIFCRLWAIIIKTFRLEHNSYDVLFRSCSGITNLHVEWHQLGEDDGQVHHCVYNRLSSILDNIVRKRQKRGWNILRNVDNGSRRRCIMRTQKGLIRKQFRCLDAQQRSYCVIDYICCHIAVAEWILFDVWLPLNWTCTVA